MTFDPVDLVPPARIMTPRHTNLLFGRPAARPKYVPGPLAEGMVRVVLTDDYYLGPGFDIYVEGSSREPYEVFDIPREQYDRWEATRTAYFVMQEEIEALKSARSAAMQGGH